MSAVIQNEFTGNNSTTQYPFTFPYLKTSDIKASLDGVETTAFTLPNATTLQFNTAPGSGVKIKIFRETSVDNLTATFYAGSAIKSEDLNDNFTQNLYKTQEVGARALNTLGGTMTGNLTLDTQADLVFEGATADAHETTIKVVDPTADRTITFPDVTGTVVTTGDTGTVATGMIAGDAITNAKIANDSIDSEHYVDGSIDTQHIANAQVTTAKIADSSVTTAKIAADAVTAAKLADNAVVTANIVDANVTTAKIAADAITNAKIADNSIDSEHYVDGSIDAAHLASNSVTNAKMADDSVGTAELQDSSVDNARLADNAVTLAKMADNSVGTSEIVDAAVTTAKIADSNVTNAKLATNSVGTAKIINSAVTTDKLNNQAVTSAKIAPLNVTTGKIADSSVTTAKIASDAVTTVKITNDAVTTAKIADSELKTLAGMQSGTASKLADSTALTADIADLNQIDGLTKQTTISDSDASFPTSGAVVDYVAAQIAPLGGLEVIANEVSFPNTQPASGVVISISDTGGVVVNGSGVSTTGRTVGGSTVTINGFPTSLQSKTMADDLGLMVSSTGSGQVYNYHKLLAKEADVEQLSNDINDFASRYRVGSSNPTSSLDNGDLFFNTSTGKMLVYNGTNTAWEEVQSIGNFFISTLSPAFDGSTQNFTITNAPSNVQQVLLSINGVVQKPNAGTSTPSEGFALDGSTIKLSAAPPTGSIYHAVVMGSTVNIGTPSNNTVSTAILQNSSVTTAKIADDAVTAAKIGDLDNDLKLLDGSKAIFGTGTDLQIEHTGGANSIQASAGQYLYIYADQLRLNSRTGAEKFISMSVNGATELYYDNVKMLETYANGVKIHQGANSHLWLNDNANLRLGTDNDLRIYHDGSHSRIDETGTGNLIMKSNVFRLRGTNDEEMIIANENGNVQLFYNGTLRLETRPNDVKFHGGLVGIDNAQIQVGSSGDLKMYHDGTNSYLDNTVTGILRIRGNNSAGVEIHPKGGQYGLRTIPDGATELYYSGSKKFETTNSGVKITSALGIANVGGTLAGSGGTENWIGFKDTSNAFRFIVKTAGTNVGGVGIGTTSPTAASGETSLNIYANEYPELHLTSSVTGTGASDGSIISLNNDSSTIIRNQENSYIRFDTNGSNERMRILAGGGITFNGDTSTANALDDYEEGTWTPVLNGYSPISYHNPRIGYYTKIGNVVNFLAYIYVYQATGSNSGISISLPFTSASGSGRESGAYTSYSNGLFSSSWNEKSGCTWLIGSNYSTCRPIKATNGAVIHGNDTELGTGGNNRYIIIHGTMYV